MKLNSTWFKWQDGRMHGYPLPFDIWLIKYPMGSEIGWHKDEVPVGFVHHRLNLVLRFCRGGFFQLVNEKRIGSQFLSLF